MKKLFSVLILLAAVSGFIFALDNTPDFTHPLQNVSYENVEIQNMKNWWSWARTKGALKAAFKTKNNSSYYEISYNAKDDYSIGFAPEINVQKGDTYLITMSVLVFSGRTGCSFVTKDDKDQVLNWTASSSDTKSLSGENKNSQLQTVYSLISITEEDKVAKIQPRIVGSGKGKFQIQSVSLQKISGLEPQPSLAIENDILKVQCSCETASFDVTDRRNGKIYTQCRESLKNLLLTQTESSPSSITLTFVNLSEKMNVILTAVLPPSSDTLEYKITAQSLDGSSDMTEIAMSSSLELPQKSVTKEGDYIVLPENEGMAYDWNDTTIPDSWPKSLVFYSGHGLCMDFYGITSAKDGAGFITIVETPDDAAAVLLRRDTNCVGMSWYSQKEKFGYERKITQTFLTQGNHVAIAKKYREYAAAQGKVVTFEQKKELRGGKNSTGAQNIEKLMGAANIWSWNNEWEGHTPATLAKQMQEDGIDRILWSTRQSEKVVKELNELGILTGAYDIYQDIMPEKYYKQVSYIDERAWKSYAYPDSISIDKNGEYVTAWGVSKKNGSGYIYCLNLCDVTAPALARKIISEEQETIPYGARFLDTTTASPLRECYSASHPMNRSQSRQARTELFKVISDENHLVCGSETGMDWAIPDCDYFEGMLSIGPYRCTNSGRDIDKVYEKAEPQILEYQLNEKRRLPLFELVYHDCCVAMWYWDDSNNKFADVMDTRDCFNALYACPPMYWVYSDKFWKENGSKIIRSYKRSSDIVYAAAGVEMTNHEYLKEDRSIQRTTFASGLVVTVDFNTKEINWEK